MTPEGAVLSAILDYLAARHVLAFRMNTGAVSAEHKGKKRFMRFGTPGMADILAFGDLVRIHDRDEKGNLNLIILRPIIWIEVKSATGKQSELQRSFQQQVEEYGHRYIIARSIEDVERELNGR